MREQPTLQLTKTTLLFNLKRSRDLQRDFITLRGISLLTRTPFVEGIFYSFLRIHTGVSAPSDDFPFRCFRFYSRLV